MFVDPPSLGRSSLNCLRLDLYALCRIKVRDINDPTLVILATRPPKGCP